MPEITGIQYMETDGIQYPVLEEPMSEEKVLATLSKYGRMAARDLQESDPDRYEMMLLTGTLLPKMQEVEKQAEKMHNELAESLLKAWMKEENVDPYDTMKMTSLRIQAEMEAEETVLKEVIHQNR